MISIISKEEIEGRLADGINTVLNLEDDDFQKFLDTLRIKPDRPLEDIKFFYATDDFEGPEVETILGLDYENKGRRYFAADSIVTDKFLKKISSLENDSPENSKLKSRCQEILNTRNLEALKEYFLNISGKNFEIVNKIFEIVENKEVYEKFLEYDKNQEYFSINNNSIEIQQYFKIMGKMFGQKNHEGNLKGIENISKKFYIPKLDEIQDKVLGIYNNFNVERYIDPRYEFKTAQNFETIIRSEDEPNWNINPELYETVYKDMPEDLSLEEKALYIYTKLCSIFEYNEEYIYRGKVIDSDFGRDFSKEHLEQLTPNSKITCYDFSRIFSKLVNEIEGNIEAVIISKGVNQGHFLAGFYTDKVSVELEPIKITQQENEDTTNDLMKAKEAIKLSGIKPIFDKNGVVESALNKVYQLVYGKKEIGINDYIQQLKNLPKTEVVNDVDLKLESFIEIMKDKGITGNEFVQTLNTMSKANFWGENIEKAYIGQKYKIDGQEHIQRMILIRNKQNSDENLYLIDTSTLEMKETNSEFIIEKLKSGQMIYENDKHKIKGIGEEEKYDSIE